VLPSPLDQLGEGDVAVDVTHPIAAANPEARQISRGEVVVVFDHGGPNLRLRPIADKPSLSQGEASDAPQLLPSGVSKGRFRIRFRPTIQKDKP
jgi:hypothetical protein